MTAAEGDEPDWMDEDLRTEWGQLQRQLGRGSKASEYIRDQVNRLKKRSDVGSPNDAAWKKAFAKWPLADLREERRALSGAGPAPKQQEPAGGRFDKAGKTPSGAEAPPLPPEAIERFDQMRVAKRGRLLTTHAEDVVWAQQMIDRGEVSPMDAPSESAWSMLHYAKAYRTKFFEKFVPDALREIQAKEAVKEEEETVELSDVDKRATGVMRMMLKQALRESQEITLNEKGELSGPYV